MSPRIQKTVGWIACGIILLAELPMNWKLKTLKNQASRISSNISQAKRTTTQYRQEADFIWKQLEGRQRELEKNTVAMDNPIVWCVGWIRNRVGLAEDVGIECIGTMLPSGMATGRAVRDAMEGTIACLTPYTVRLDLPKTSLGTLQYVLEQLESTSFPSIVTYLELNPLESESGYSATAIVSLPFFQYSEDKRDIREFLAAEIPESLPSEGTVIH